MSRLTLARNAASLVLSDFAIRAFSAIGVVLVARSLGPRSYGILSVAVAFSSVVAYLSDLGLTHLTIQNATKPGADLGLILGTVFKLRLALVLLVATGSLAGIWLLYPGQEERLVMLLVVLPSICGVAMQGFAASYFWATEQLHVTAALKTASQVFSALGFVLAFLLRWPVQGVASIYGLTSLLGGLACLWMTRRMAPRMAGWDRSLLKGLTAFTVGGVTGIALPQLGPLVMERVTAAAQVGYFAAASRIPALLYTIPNALGITWYPMLFQAGSHDADKHFALSVEQLKLNVILSFGLAIPVALYAGPIIGLVLGAAWRTPTAPILTLLCWMVVLNSITIPFADALTTKGLQGLRAWVYLGALAAGVVLFAVLASRWGATGAAWAAISTQTLLSAGLILVNPSGRALLAASLPAFLRPVGLASACTVLCYWLLPESVFAAAVVAGVFFGVAIVSDLQLRTGFRKAANMVNARLRYACQD